MPVKVCAMKSSWACVRRMTGTVVALECLWKLCLWLLITRRVRLSSLSVCLFKGSANCSAFAVAPSLYLSKGNLFWGYLVPRGELCKLMTPLRELSWNKTKLWLCLLTSAAGFASSWDQRPDIHHSHKQQLSFGVSHLSYLQIPVRMDP